MGVKSPYFWKHPYTFTPGSPTQPPCFRGWGNEFHHFSSKSLSSSKRNPSIFQNVGNDLPRVFYTYTYAIFWSRVSSVAGNFVKRSEFRLVKHRGCWTSNYQVYLGWWSAAILTEQISLRPFTVGWEFLQMVMTSKGIPPRCPKQSGLGIINLHRETYVLAILFIPKKWCFVKVAFKELHNTPHGPTNLFYVFFGLSTMESWQISSQKRWISSQKRWIFQPEKVDIRESLPWRKPKNCRLISSWCPSIGPFFFHFKGSLGMMIQLTSKQMLFNWVFSVVSFWTFDPFLVTSRILYNAQRGFRTFRTKDERWMYQLNSVRW